MLVALTVSVWACESSTSGTGAPDAASSDEGGGGGGGEGDVPGDLGPGSDEGGVPDVVLSLDVDNTPPPIELGPSKVGGVCSRDEDCVDGWCNTSYVGGYCSALCQSNGDCPDNAQCFPDNKSGEKMCWKTCLSGYDCRIDQFCPASGSVCTPRCQVGDCNAGYICDTSLVGGQCVPEGQIQCEPSDEVCDGVDNDCDYLADEGCGPGVAAGETHLVEDLGLVAVGGGGVSSTLSFKLSSAASSFTIVAMSADASEELLFVYELKHGAENLILPTDPVSSPIRTYPGIGVTSVLVPNTPLVELSPGGTYKFSLYRDGPVGEAWVYVVQNLREAPTASKLAVNFWFVGLPGLDADKAQSDPQFVKLLDKFSEILEGAGVTVDDVEYRDITGTDAQTYTFVDTADGYEVDEHAELLALSSALPEGDRGVNFFFVQGFNGWGLLGKAGGIPGTPLAHGTWESGVVVSLADFLSQDEEIGIPLTAEAMAHELGHQLGLYHTSERTGAEHDPLPDTPECKNDFNGDGLIDLAECQNKGTDNLMFWSTTFATKLTGDQKFVIHRNPSLD